MKPKQYLNKYRNLKSYFHRRVICDGYPEVFNIELTNACPMTCIMCPRRYMKRKIGFMKLSTFKKIVDELKGYTHAVWLHHFGESLLHPKLKPMLAYAKSKGLKTQLSINPILLTKENTKKIKNLDYLHISLDGTNQETLKKLRGKAADYDKSVKYIRTYLKLKKRPKTTIAIIRLKQTEKELDKFVETWKDSGAELEAKEFTTWDGSQKSIEKLASGKQLSEAYKKAMQHPCIRPWHRFTIMWDGRVVPCCFDYDGKYILGDFKEQTLEEIWNSESMIELRKQHILNDFSKNKLCKNCKEKYGMPASYLYPCNISFIKRAFRYFTQKLK